MNWKKKEVWANSWESRVELECGKRIWNSQFNSVRKLMTAGIAFRTKQIKMRRKYRIIENWRKNWSREKGIWFFRCIASRNCKECSVYSCIVAVITMTVECKLFWTGKQLCTRCVGLLKWNYKFLHQKRNKWVIKFLMAYYNSSSAGNYIDASAFGCQFIVG